jgi:hypothetical protein
MFPFVSFRSPSLFYRLVHSRCRGFLFSLDHTQTHTTVGRTPLDEGSARRRDLYLTTQTLTRDKHSCPRWVRTDDPSKRSAADPRLRPCGHWDRIFYVLTTIQFIAQQALQLTALYNLTLICVLPAVWNRTLAKTTVITCTRKTDAVHYN